jgi:hypothetical protein
MLLDDDIIIIAEKGGWIHSFFEMSTKDFLLAVPE